MAKNFEKVATISYSRYQISHKRRYGVVHRKGIIPAFRKCDPITKGIADSALEGRTTRHLMAYSYRDNILLPG